MGPEAESRAGQAESTSQSLGHGLVRALAVTTPVDGESLSTGSGRSGKQRRLVFTQSVTKGVVHALVVNVGVVAGRS